MPVSYTSDYSPFAIHGFLSVQEAITEVTAGEVGIVLKPSENYQTAA